MTFFDIARPPAPSVYDTPKPVAPKTSVANAALPSASAAPAATTAPPTATATASTPPATTATAAPTMSATAAPTATGADDRSTEFKAVNDAAEARSGTTLMVEAYSVLWMLLMGFIFFLWRKQNDLNVRLDGLERAIDARADAADAKNAKTDTPAKTDVKS